MVHIFISNLFSARVFLHRSHCHNSFVQNLYAMVYNITSAVRFLSAATKRNNKNTLIIKQGIPNPEETFMSNQQRADEKKLFTRALLPACISAVMANGAIVTMHSPATGAAQSPKKSLFKWVAPNQTVFVVEITTTPISMKYKTICFSRSLSSTFR